MAWLKILTRQLEKEIVQFKTGIQAAYLRVGDVVDVIDETFDFAVKSRHQTLQLDYHAALNQHATIFASASRHRNWDNQEGQKNTMLFTGLNVTF